jgi:CHAT domain
MTRTVVTFVGTTKTFIMLDDTNSDISLDDLSEVDLSMLPEGTLVQRGEALLAVLSRDAAVQQGLNALLLNPLGSEPAPLYFRMRASAADTLAWEQLHADTKGFLALDHRWPIGRIARQPRPLAARVFDPPLRVVAILSAAGRDGSNQLDALADACEDTQIRVRLHVISGDDHLLETAKAKGISCEHISPSGPGLMRQIASADPDILHVLCHGGGSVGGEKRLVFADPNDFDAAQLDPTVRGSIFASVNQLATALAPVELWLVVLAACQSAEAENPDEGLALAHDLACGGVPAVIGMRRLVDISATDAFCREFYPEAFKVVGSAVGATAPVPGPPRRTIDWAQALTGPRIVMGDPDPEIVDSWTDPVLYAQYGDLEVVVPTPQVSLEAGARLQGRIDKLKGGLAVAVAGGAQPALLDELQNLIADLERRAR